MWKRAAGFSVMAAVAAAVMVHEPRRAEACGGCFGPTQTIQTVTDHRMVLSIHSDETILWDQIRYSGDPADFSWVLPVSGTVRVELASGAFFDTLDRATATTVVGPPPDTSCSRNFFGPSSSGADASASDASGSVVTVVQSAVVGPYETVVLRSTDAMALSDWLRGHDYVIPPALEPVIASYVSQHMDFLALRLAPGEGIHEMQPVRVRYASANMVLPLRMVAAGVADKVGIALWVFGFGRHEAGNFANGEINPDKLRWNFDTNTSNYTQVFDNTVRGLDGGRSWITEHATDTSYVSWSFESYRNACAYAGYYTPGCSNYVGNTDAGSDGGVVAPPWQGLLEDWDLATANNATGMWVTKLRTDLLTRFLDSDLQLQASANNGYVIPYYSLDRNHTEGTPPQGPCGAYFASDSGTLGGCSVGVGFAGGARGALVFAVAALFAARRRREN